MRSSGKLMLPPSSGGSSLKGNTMPQAAIDEISRLQQDLVLLTQKVADLSGEPQRAPAAPVLDGGPSQAPNSPFVSGLRGMAEGASSSSSSSSGGAVQIKMDMLEKVLKKVAELDRLLLKNTAPAGQSANARRGSRGMDLFSLPTHLHVTDRLLDLHTQSKRVITVTTTKAGGGVPESSSSSSSEPPSAHPQPPATPAAAGGAGGAVSPRPAAGDKEVAKKAAAEVVALKAKLEESESKRQAIKDDCAVARKENIAYKKELAEVKTQLLAMQQAAGQDDREARIQQLLAQVADLQAQGRAQQEALEVEIARSAKAVEVVTQQAATVKNNHAEYGNSPQKEPKSSSGGSDGAQGDDAQNALLGQPMAHSLRLLHEALKGRLGGMHEQLLSMNMVKETLEADVQTIQMAHDMVTKDFLSVQQELEIMRAAHTGLQAESLNNDATQKLERANNLLLDLQAEVAAAHRRTFDLERLPPRVAELEFKLRTAETKVLEQAGELEVQSGELESYKKMSESLKNKIRELSSKDGDSKDFMDSFEEVMQDEMYTMKLAFEAKLKCKADEVSALAQRHAMEINRIQANSSPYVRR